MQAGIRVGEGTFVFDEVAHARPAGEDELRDVLDDFGLVLRRQSGEPFGQALKRPSISFR